MCDEFQSASSIYTLKVNILLKLSQSVHCCFKINIVLVEANDEKLMSTISGEITFRCKAFHNHKKI